MDVHLVELPVRSPNSRRRTSVAIAHNSKRFSAHSYLSLGGAERPTQQWWHSHQLEERRGRRHSLLTLRCSIDIDRFVGELEECLLPQRSYLLSTVKEVSRTADKLVPDSGLRIPVRHQYDSVRVRNRQWSQQDRVDDRKNCD